MAVKPVELRKHLILFDIDGVCADDSERVQFAVDKEWTEYFGRIMNDTPFREGLDMAWRYAEQFDFEVQYLTGRRVDLYAQTSQWLDENGFPNPSKITMRGFAHRDILAKYKEGVMRNALEGGEFASAHLFEDDPAVVAHINRVFGEGHATLCTWYTKHEAMVKEALA